AVLWCAVALVAVSGSSAVLPPRGGPEAGSRPVLADPSAAHGAGHAASRQPAGHRSRVGPSAASARISIPDLGIEQELIDLPVVGAELQAPHRYGDIGWWSAGPTPGAPGAAVVVGHLDSPTGPAIFYTLADLSPGAEITVRRADGWDAVFELERVERYPRTSFPSERVYRRSGPPALHLLTCGGRYDGEAGRYEANVVAYASLTALVLAEERRPQPPGSSR
ncbi:MAG: sortase domain-containing protein, partial [Carbonactinosporaceae bacterium]